MKRKPSTRQRWRSPQPALVFDTIKYHVINRGNGRRTVFRKQADSQAYMSRPTLRSEDSASRQTVGIISS